VFVAKTLFPLFWALSLEIVFLMFGVAFLYGFFPAFGRAFFFPLFSFPSDPDHVHFCPGGAICFLSRVCRFPRAWAGFFFHRAFPPHPLSFGHRLCFFDPDGYPLLTSVIFVNLFRSKCPPTFSLFFFPSFRANRLFAPGNATFFPFFLV